MILAQVTCLSLALVLSSLGADAQFWKNDKIVKQWQQPSAEVPSSGAAPEGVKSPLAANMASSYMNAFVPAAINSGLGSLIGSFASEPASKQDKEPKEDYAKNYAPASSAATYEHAPALKQPSPNYAPAYPLSSYDSYKGYPSHHETSYPSEHETYKSEYKPPSYSSHETYQKSPSYSSYSSYSSEHEYNKAPYEYKSPSYGEHEYKHEYKHEYPAVLPPSVLPQGAYPIHQPTITNTGETIIENLVGGIAFDCRGRSTGHWRDNKYCDIFHACVFGIQRKTYVCPYVGERTYFDEATKRCEFVYRNPHGCGSGSYYH